MSHPMTKVPAGYTIPQGWPLFDGAMTCLTCHVAGHLAGAAAGQPDEPAGGPYLLRGAAAGDRVAICHRCHAKSTWAGRNPHQDAAPQADRVHPLSRQTAGLGSGSRRYRDSSSRTSTSSAWPAMTMATTPAASATP